MTGAPGQTPRPGRVPGAGDLTAGAACLACGGSIGPGKAGRGRGRYCSRRCARSAELWQNRSSARRRGDVGAGTARREAGDRPAGWAGVLRRSNNRESSRRRSAGRSLAIAIMRRRGIYRISRTEVVRFGRPGGG